MYLKSTNHYVVLRRNNIVGWKKTVMKIKSTNKYIGLRSIYINGKTEIDESSFCIFDTIDSVEKSLKNHDSENELDREDKFTEIDEVDFIMNTEVREEFVPIFKRLLNCSELMEKLTIEEKEEIKQIIN